MEMALINLTFLFFLKPDNCIVNISRFNCIRPIDEKSGPFGISPAQFGSLLFDPLFAASIDRVHALWIKAPMNKPFEEKGECNGEKQPRGH